MSDGIPFTESITPGFTTTVSQTEDSLMEVYGSYIFGGCGASFIVLVILITVLVFRKIRRSKSNENESTPGR